MAMSVIMVVAMLLVVGLAVRELILFRRQRNPYGLRQLILRLSMAVMLLLLLGSVLVGVHLFHLDTPEAYPRHWLAFWGCIGMLTGALFCLVLADLRMLRDANRNDVGQLWKEIAETIARHELHRKDR